MQGRQTKRSVTSKVRENLSSDKYIIIENTHEAIISKEDFNAVQALIETRKRKRPYAETHLFTNTLIRDTGQVPHPNKYLQFIKLIQPFDVCPCDDSKNLVSQ